VLHLQKDIEQVRAEPANLDSAALHPGYDGSVEIGNETRIRAQRGSGR
jgi:hypothetical protein